MRVASHWLVILAAFATAFASQVAARDMPPLSAYGALPDVEDAAISPSGQNIAILLTRGGVRQVLLFGPEMTLLKRVTVNEVKVRGFDWIGDDQLLLVTSQTEDLWGFTTDKAEFSIARLVPATFEGDIETVFAGRRSLVDSVVGSYGRRLVDGRWKAYFGAIELNRAGFGPSKNTWKHGRPYLYQVDTLTNQPRRLAVSADEGHYRDWLIGADGEVAATLDLDRTDGDWKIRNGAGDTIVSGSEVTGRVRLMGLGHDGKTAIYSARDDDGFNYWFEIPLAGGEPKPFLEGVDVDRFYWDETTGHLTGYLDARIGVVFENPKYQKAARAIHKAFAGYDMRMVDWTPDFQKVLVRTSGNQDSGSWFKVDLSTGRANAIAYERPALTPQFVGAISTVNFGASDGLEMDGILTLPPDREAKGLPVVMLPHGGPQSHDRERFSWWAQAFASRGYAVFQPNFRGSTNRNQAFKLAGYGEWGRKMQTDISDGLSALAKAGIVDPSRACIVGASYGGYAALAGVTIQDGIYRCAVAVAPVSDLSALYREGYQASGARRITKRSLLEQLGPKDRWDEVSPRRNAHRADAPILLIHGVDDTVVPYSHSDKMADALKDARKPFELVTLDSEDHWLSRSETRLQMLEAAVGFVEKHNPAD